MALMAMIKRHKIDAKEKELSALRAKEADFNKREADIEAAIKEAAELAKNAETDEAKAEADEAQAAVEREAETYEEERAAFDKQIKEIEDSISDLKKALKEIEEENEKPQEDREAKPATEEIRKENIEIMETRAFSKMTMQERSAFFMRDDVKSYLAEIRSCMREKRALTNVGLTIPEVFLGYLRENIRNYSKLYKHVNVRPLGGDGRMVVMGSIPEAVWTDCCANLNELDLVFNDTEINCWKVGGYFAICNAALEDSDIDLANELMVSLGQSIGYALDKAILYGTGSRMPEGVMTRLVQTSAPSDYRSTERAWVDLHQSNIKSIAATASGVDLFKEIVIDAGAAKGDFSRGNKTWIMNETTYTQIIANAMSINASGAIVTGVNGYMPVLGGDIEVLNFIPDNVIIGGYFDLYLLGERAGQKFATSEHVKFLNDQTVFKGTARYDGKPVIAEAFCAIGLNGVTPNATMTFAADAANTGA